MFWDLLLILAWNKGVFPSGLQLFVSYSHTDEWISPKITPAPKMLVHALRPDLLAARLVPTEFTGEKFFKKGLSASGHGKVPLNRQEGVATTTL